MVLQNSKCKHIWLLQKLIAKFICFCAANKFKIGELLIPFDEKDIISAKQVISCMQTC